jgi:prevent-host-death family protein
LADVKKKRPLGSPVRVNSKPAGLRKAAVAERPGPDEVVSVRTAKARLSALLEQVAAGGRILITSDGRPKARLVPVESASRKVFSGSAQHLASMPPWPGGRDSTDLISEDRDARGW